MSKYTPAQVLMAIKVITAQRLEKSLKEHPELVDGLIKAEKEKSAKSKASQQSEGPSRDNNPSQNPADDSVKTDHGDTKNGDGKNKYGRCIKCDNVKCTCGDFKTLDVESASDDASSGPTEKGSAPKFEKSEWETLEELKKGWFGGDRKANALAAANKGLNTSTPKVDKIKSDLATQGGRNFAAPTMPQESPKLESKRDFSASTVPAPSGPLDVKTTPEEAKVLPDSLNLPKPEQTHKFDKGTAPVEGQTGIPDMGINKVKLERGVPAEEQVGPGKHIGQRVARNIEWMQKVRSSAKGKEQANSSLHPLIGLLRKLMGR